MQFIVFPMNSFVHLHGFVNGCMRAVVYKYAGSSAYRACIPVPVRLYDILFVEPIRNTCRKPKEK